MALSSRIRDFTQSLSRLQRELLILAAAVVLGFAIMPALIWLIGSGVMGKYAGGNTVFSLYGNFFKALAQGAMSFWIVALGPYGLISLLRLLIALLFGRPTDDEDTETRAPPKRRTPQVSDERRTAPTEARRPPPQPNRTPPAPQSPPSRKAPPKPGERRTPYIKSID